MKKSLLKSGAALVTGGARRIGQGICLQLADMGYNIVLHYHHSRQEAEATALAIRAKGVKCTLLKCDLADSRRVSVLMSQAHAIFPDLNVLVNSASIFEPSGFEIKSLALYDAHFAINLKAPFILSCEFKRLCRKGQIINLIDTDVVKNKSTHTAYLLTKKALAEMTKMAAVDFAPHIRVNAIAPGLILPPKNHSVAFLDRRAQSIPLKRRGGISYIAKSVKFLIENDFMTGQCLFNDGGEQLVGY